MTSPRARRRLLLLAAAALALLFCFIFAPSRLRDSKPHLPPAADPSVRLDLAPAEIFRRAFWRQPTPADRIVHAERREWKDAADAVQRWQWFLQVEPGPALLAALRDPAVFGLAPVAAPRREPSALPAWFPAAPRAGDEILQSPAGGLTIFYREADHMLFATDSGRGFAPPATGN